MSKILDVQIGDRYGDLICVGKVNRRGRNGLTANYYVMRCSICGREKEMLSSTIRLKHGIYHKACGKGIKTLDPVFYSRWQAMRTRTTNPNYQHADCYSKKGISSDEFTFFIDFYDKMYSSYKELADKIGAENVSLERLDNEKSYSVDNCIWIDKHEQQKNTSRIVTFKVILPDGRVEFHKNVSDYAKRNGLDSSTILDVLSGRSKTHKGIRFERVAL